MKQACRVAITLALAFCPAPATAALLRRGGGAVTGELVKRSDPDSVESIQERWDKMDDFLEVMFVMACRWKHGKDVNGLAAEKLRDGEIKPDQVLDFKKKLQAKNLIGLKEACGKIVAQGKGKCRQSCADRYGNAMEKRSDCDGKCVSAYGNFETECVGKASNLEKVYATKIVAAEGRERCFEGHCAEFPTVWLKDEASMSAEVDAQCESRCAPEKIEEGCNLRWRLQVDMVSGKTESECFGEIDDTKCLKEQKDTISGDHQKCQDGGSSTCDTQHAECEAKGVDVGKDFCSDRLRMCKEQVAKNCLDDHQKALDAAAKKCKQDGSSETNKCVEDKLESMRTEELEKCKTERQPKCDQDCHKKCDLDKMNGCLGNLASDSNPAEDFCMDFWKLLHKSSAVDPVTGNPIVLLASNPHQ